MPDGLNNGSKLKLTDLPPATPPLPSGFTGTVPRQLAATSDFRLAGIFCAEVLEMDSEHESLRRLSPGSLGCTLLPLEKRSFNVTEAAFALFSQGELREVL